MAALMGSRGMDIHFGQAHHGVTPCGVPAAGIPAAGMQASSGFQPARHVEPGCPYREDDVMQPEQAALSTGTTIMAIEYDGGVCLAADTRTSTGDFIAQRDARKISKVYDKIFVCRSGSAADTQMLTSFVQNYIGQHAIELGGRPTVNTAASLFRLLAYNNKDHLTAGLIVAGWDEKKKGQVYSIPLGGTMIKTPIAMSGSGSGYISALVDSKYREGMTKAEVKEFARLCVSHAMSVDGSSGGMVRTVCVDGSGIEEEVILGDQLPKKP